ncbi:MAG: ComF family protein [Clostridia bacterium]|nr:ComF family protein [Clostridia bacterium]
MNIYNIYMKILDFIYPNSIYCLCCGNAIDETRSYSLCDRCVRDIRWAAGRNCRKCGKPLEDSWLGDRCADCMETFHSFDKGYCAMQYGIHGRALAMGYKYGGKTYMASFLAKAMADRLSIEDEKWDLLVPVATEREKERERGFDHAYLLASHLAREMNIKCLPALRRKKRTLTQKELDPVKRRENMRGAFQCVLDVTDRDILLVDDVYTTGATVDECARVLKERGAARVDFVVLASGGNRHIAN